MLAEYLSRTLNSQDITFHVGYKHITSYQKHLEFCSVVLSSCCIYKLLEISRLLSHADLPTIELSRTFLQVTHLLYDTTKIVLM